MSHAARSADFIRAKVLDDKASGRATEIRTRFPPEPNGYLHLGHAKAIVLNFDIAREHGGTCNLRFDDTNPDAEDQEFVDAIVEDVRWLGFEPDAVLFASDYFDQLYEWAEQLVSRGMAYVDEQPAEIISAQRGSFGKPGVDSPFRDRAPEENLALLQTMRAAELADGQAVLRAKVDMAHEVMTMRDPVLYRIRHSHHQRTGDMWCIYPTYDWAHGLSDAIEGISHSLCTLEFEDHRPLYNWLLDATGVDHPRPEQIEFARLNFTHTVMSKRVLRRLVANGMVDGWDDPQMPTLRAARRRGFPAEAIVELVRHVGVAKTNSVVEIELLESFVRRQHNRYALRRAAVLDPIKLIITNWPVDDEGNGVVEMVDAINNPEDPDAGVRSVPFDGVLWIERDDYRAQAEPKYYRLTPGREVRLRYAYFVTAVDHVVDEDGQVVEVHATYDPATVGGNAPDGRKVKATIHWVSCAAAVDGTVHRYDRLFPESLPDAHDPEIALDARRTYGAKLEAALEDVEAGDVVQFERVGYFSRDVGDGPVFHETAGLRDEWAAIQKAKAKASQIQS
ncbi:MAG: glutamine--tRNA ligase/YqeY domain fusion protein [bacterium]|nr:glutamine--tRNA ligase/YqeY domain fusion protein [bacterium]